MVVWSGLIWWRLGWSRGFGKSSRKMQFDLQQYCVVFFFYNRLFIFDRELSINDCCPSAFFYFSFSFDQISGTELEAGKGGPEAAEGSQGGIQVKNICDEVKFYNSVLFYSYSLGPGVVEEKSCFLAPQGALVVVRV